MPCKCEFCHAILSKPANLKRHQKTTKKCLEIQNANVNIKLLENVGNNTEIKINSHNTNNINTNITNNVKNINNIIVFKPDFSKKHILEVISHINADMLKEKNGLSNLYVNKIAKNDKGEYGIVNTNKKNPIFYYLDNDGTIKIDTDGTQITKRFLVLSESAITDFLVDIKQEVKNETDYSEIEENSKNPKHFIKNLSNDLYINNIVSKSNQNPNLWNEEDENPELFALKNELKILKNKKLKLDEIELDFDELNIAEADIDSIIKEKQKIQYKFDRDKEKSIKKIEKKIDKFDPKWYTEKRQQNERKEKTKNKIISKKSNENAKMGYKDIDEGGILKYILEFE